MKLVAYGTKQVNKRTGEQRISCMIYDGEGDDAGFHAQEYFPSWTAAMHVYPNVVKRGK